MQMFIFNSLELNELNGGQLLASELSQQRLFYLLSLPDSSNKYMELKVFEKE